MTLSPGTYGQNLAEGVEAQVLRNPEQVAIRTRRRSITYGELNRDANCLARALVAARGTTAEPVALLLTDDIRLVTAMLAVVKAGKFYVPLDPTHPPARLANMLKSSTAAVLLSEPACGGVRAQFSALELQALEVGVAGAGLPENNLAIPIKSDALAQVLFTSGSTGEPKGVMHSHRALMHTIYRHASSLEITAADRLTLLGARSSAQCMTGIWKALLNGAALYPYKIRDEGLPGLVDWLTENDITIYTSSASVFRYFGEMLDGSKTFPKLRVVQLGGEPIARHDFGLFQKRFPPGCVMVNTLSATEAGSIRQNVLKWDANVPEALVPVGYPVPEVDVLLWDDDGKPVGPGEVGEIVVRSTYLADGYWRRPDLAAALFLPDPDGGSRRLFRTGDLGRISAEGRMEHLGRKDFCLKIRGNRVELAEIEATLLEAPGVKQQVVMAREDGPGEPRVVAYIVPAPGPPPTVPALRGFVAGLLPEYMIPSAFVFLDALPTTPNGKVDRAALPPPGEAAPANPNRVVPRTLLETQLLHIWNEELGISNFGVKDDFFDLGGNSLLANRMFHRVEQECGQRVVPANLLPGLTVERMANEMVRSDSDRPRNLMAEIQAGAPGRVPFFFVHADHESGGFYCRRLAHHMGDDQPFYAFTPHGMDGRPIPESFQAIAADHLRELLAFRPSGPYLIGGYCNGGLIAYEMAQQMRRKGLDVACVLMVDARAYNAPLLRTWKISKIIAGTLRMSPATHLNLFRRMRWWRTDLAESGGGISGWGRFAGRKFTRLLGLRPATVREAVAPEVIDDAAGERGGLWPAYHARVTLYVPDHYNGRVVLFRSSHVDQRPPRTWDAGWEPVAHNFEVHRTPGNHRECLTTYAGELARAMRPYLDQYQPNARQTPVIPPRPQPRAA